MTDRPTKHRTVAVDVDAIPEAAHGGIPWPWYAIATIGALAVLAAGWLLMAGITALGWLTSPEAELNDALLLASDVLLLAHGVPVEVGGTPVSIMPLGLSLIMVVLALPVANLAARQAAGTKPGDGEAGRTRAQAQAIVARVAGTMAITHGVSAAILATALGVPGGTLRALLGGVVLSGVAGLWGASMAVSFDFRRDWPGWVRAVPMAMSAAVLVCLAGGAVVLASALIAHRGRIGEIHAALEPGIAGTIILVLVQLLYLPNLVLWATAWVLGAGITLGDDSLLTMSVTDVGFLPAIPVFGAVGEPGLGGGVLLWWLLVGVVAGLVAAIMVVMARPRARFDETALVGGLSGVVAGLLITVLCSLAGGGLGAARLAHVGPVVQQLVIVAPTLLGLSGLVGGALLGLLRRPRTDAPVEAEEPLDSTNP
ncbi:MAG: DUF6350 family protein [Propionibacteriaceae bacterium]|nr:DUF6350 family protein [Propionibacteriaceae bacterium]